MIVLHRASLGRSFRLSNSSVIERWERIQIIHFSIGYVRVFSALSSSTNQLITEKTWTSPIEKSITQISPFVVDRWWIQIRVFIILPVTDPARQYKGCPQRSLVIKLGHWCKNSQSQSKRETWNPKYKHWVEWNSGENLRKLQLHLDLIGWIVWGSIPYDQTRADYSEGNSKFDHRYLSSAYM
jgi:hypothetical protein